MPFPGEPGSLNVQPSFPLFINKPPTGFLNHFATNQSNMNRTLRRRTHFIRNAGYPSDGKRRVDPRSRSNFIPSDWTPDSIALAHKYSQHGNGDIEAKTHSAFVG